MLYVYIYFLVIISHSSDTKSIHGTRREEVAFAQIMNFPTVNKFLLADYGFTSLLETLHEQRIKASIKQMEAKEQLRLKEERENEIFLKRLATKVHSSFLRDFHTLRY
jgi:hypothetical protein